ncbi:MAG TPA: hypothetical protein VK886_06260 [Vicinamibacterales bacterium]|nr:hypothetical protein [Vicinamibacterales bacterium]
MTPKSAGYSGTPLPRKLEIKDGSRIALVGAPADFEDALGTLPPGAKLRRGIAAPRDLTIWFVTSRKQLEGDLRRMAPPRDAAAPGHLWIAWPKRTSGMATDLTEDVLREVVLPIGMVDRKVCAIDETWSGLLFSWRRGGSVLR